MAVGAEIRLQSPSGSRGDIHPGGGAAAVPRLERKPWLYQSPGRPQRLATGAGTAERPGEAVRRLLQARQPRRRGGGGAARAGAGGNLRGGRASDISIGGGVAAGAGRGPHVFLWRFRGAERPDGRRHGTGSERGGLRRRNRPGFRGEGPGNPQRQKGRRVYRPGGGPGLFAPRGGSAGGVRCGFFTTPERRGIRGASPGKPGNRREDHPVGGTSRLDLGRDHREIHSVQFGRLRPRGPDDRRGSGPAKPGGLHAPRR